MYRTIEPQLDVEVRDQWERLAALQRRRARYRQARRLGLRLPKQRRTNR